jgi:class 3 adenylate cyclase/tetratricopeptide (TPR) repeat protein
MADLTPYVPRILLEWERQFGDARHQAVDGTLVFADVSGFTRLSERLARAGGKIGAEQMTDVVNALFGELLGVGARRGGEMLKYGGDAVLVFFRGEDHPLRAAAACVEMQQRLREIGRVDSGAGVVRLRMSVGLHSGTFDLFVVGESHRELVVAGPAASTTVAMEAAADATEILASPSTAAALDPAVLGAAKAGGRLIRRVPAAPEVAPLRRTADPRAASFVPVGLRPHLVAGDVEPGHHLVAQAFLHLGGVDDLLAEAGPAAAAAALHRTVTVVQQACEAVGVTFLSSDIAANGTKVILVAGAPEAVEEAEERVVHCVRRILEQCPPLPVRAGVHRGHVFVGEVGPPYRRTFTTIGDVTNTAARVMGRAESGEVLALRDVIDHLHGDYPIDELEPFMAKGKSEPLVPYRIGEERMRDAGADARPSLPLVGRAHELARILDALRGLEAGAGGFLELVGPVGIGKSRLVEEARASIDGGTRAYVLRCEPYEQATPFFPFRHLLAAVLSVRGRGEQGRTELEATIAERAPALLPWLPLIGDVLDLDVPETDQTESIAVQFRRQRTFLVVEELLSEALTGPAIVVVEDTHWADEASQGLLRHLSAGAGRHPWFLLTTTRVASPWVAAEQSVEVTPLDDDESRRLVDVTAETPVRPDRLPDIVERAAGNPLFIVELLRARAPGADELPDSLEAVVAAQISTLPPVNRSLLRHAAVLGSAFDVGLLRSVSDTPLPTQPQAIARRLGDLVVVEEGVRLRFRHQLVRDVAYESLPFRVRRSLHGRAGEALEAAAGDEVADRAGVLSLHFFHAGDHERTWRYAVQAAKRAHAKFANIEAIGLYRRALSAARSLSGIEAQDLLNIWERLGDVQGLSNDTAGAAEAYRQARRFASEQSAHYGRLCRKQARLYAQHLGDHRAALRWMHRGLRRLAAEETEDSLKERSALHVLMAWTKKSAGRPRDAIRWARLAIDEGEASENHTAVALACSIIDGSLVALGEQPEATYLDRALELLEQEELHKDLAVLLNNLGAQAYYRGNWHEALELYERSRERNARVGDLAEAGFGTINVVEILCDQGHLDRADALLDDVERTWTALDFKLGLVFVDGWRGRIAMRRGDHCRAIELLAGAEERFVAAGLLAYAVLHRLAKAEALLRSGAAAAAAEIVDGALADDGTARVPGARACAHRLAGYLGLLAGDLETAWASLDESLAVARAQQAPHDVALALEAMAEVGAAGGRALDARSEEERRQVLEELGIVAPPHIVIAA